jgi:predicted DNA-binding mobile mystery protein A
MSGAELADRMGVSQQVVHQFESNEVNGTIKLDTHRRVADGLDCDVVYFLIPRQSLTGAVDEQALRKARDQLGPLGHHSRLEDQEPSVEDRQAQLAERAEALIDRRGLWS